MDSPYVRHFSNAKTPQTQSIPGSNMVQNNAGGFTFELDCWGQMRRFLILGAEGGTYYVSEQALVVENATSVIQCIKEDGARAVREIVTVSTGGLAPKNDPAIFALALAASADSAATRSLALSHLSDVCRIGTHLLQFVEAVKSQRGFGRGLVSAIQKWYTSKPVEDQAYQMLKYANRGGWTQRDVLSVAHLKPTGPAVDALYKYVHSRGETVLADAPEIVHAAVALKSLVSSPKKAAKHIEKHRLPRELVPTELLNSVEVWDALLASMPMTAMIRNLGKMTSVGLLKPLSSAAKLVQDHLADESAIKKARVHPLAILIAQKVYGSGAGIKGSLCWMPVGSISDALNRAFDLSFATVRPTGKRWYLGIDVSGSMGMGSVAGSPLKPRECAAAMATVTARIESQWAMFGFNNEMVGLNIRASDSMDAVLRKTSGLSFGTTDCAMPMLHALKEKLEVDVFTIYTDNETYVGDIHPVQALRKYRQAMGIPAKLIVVGMTASKFSIADPKDAGMLDLVGFDASAPAVMGDFVGFSSC
jgi:60 kDa SS-A/Ro ribonucleoprotein